MSYLLKESLAHTIMVYLIIRKLSLPWKEWDAYKEGIIDDKGALLKKPITHKEREAWNVFDRFVANLKRILSKFVGGSRIAAIATSAYMLKDSHSPLLNKNLLCEKVELSADLQLAIFKLEKEFGEIYAGEVDEKKVLFYIDKYISKMEKLLEKDEYKKIKELIHV